MKIINYKNKQEIKSLQDWFNQCPPKGKKKHWVKGRSAFELANEYLSNGKQSIEALFQNGDLKIDKGYPEYNTRLDDYGQGRAHDFLMFGFIDKEDILVSVEGKVDEPFGNNSLSMYYMKAKIDELNGVSTNKVGVFVFIS